jgi:hypothetical protein
LFGTSINNNFRFGDTDAAAPVAQTLSVQSVAAGTSNTAGANLTIAGSQGTGTGAGGSIIFQVAPAGSSGTSQNALIDCFAVFTYLGGTRVGVYNATTGNVALGVSSAASGNLCGLTPIDVNTFYLTTNAASNIVRIRNTTVDAAAGGLDVFGRLGMGTSAASADVMLYRDGAANTLALRNSTNAQAFRWYRTYTDASNYERGALQTASGQVILAAETAGTGGDDIDVTLTPAGAGNVRYGTHSTIGAETVTGFITIKDAGGTTRKLAVVS